MPFLTYLVGKPAPITMPITGAIMRVVAYSPDHVVFGCTPDSFGQPFGGFGLLWTGSPPGTQVGIPADPDGTPSYLVGAPDAPEAYSLEIGAGSGFDEVRFHHYNAGWTIPATDTAGWADQSDPVVWRGADPTHADAAGLAVAHFGTAHAVVWEVTYSGGTPSLSSFDAGMPGGYVERGFDIRPRLAGSPGHWWATGRSRYGDGSNDNMWVAQLTSGGPVAAWGVGGAHNSAGTCLWVGSDTDVWIGGLTDLGLVDSAGQRPYLWHHDGSTVTDFPLTGLMPADSPGAIQGIHGGATDDVWAVGHIDDQTVSPSVQRILIFHWDGAAWSAVSGLDTLLPPAHGVQQVLYDVYALATDDVWAVGTVGYSSGSDGQLLALHYDGAAWSRVALS
jgi:hypothetical protein